MRSLTAALALVSGLSAVACSSIEYIDAERGDSGEPASPLFLAPTGPNVAACGEEPLLVLGAGGVAHRQDVKVTPTGFGDVMCGVDVPVAPMFLDPHEATKACYARCVAAGFCARPVFDPQDPDARDWDHPGRALEPVGGLVFEHAEAFCGWRGGRLPTVSEFAAVGGTNGRPFDDALGKRLAVCRFDTSSYEDCQALIEQGRFGYRVGASVNTRLQTSSGPWSSIDVTSSGIAGLFGGALEWTSSTADTYSLCKGGTSDEPFAPGAVRLLGGYFLYHPAASILGGVTDENVDKVLVPFPPVPPSTSDGVVQGRAEIPPSYAAGVRCLFPAISAP